VPAPWGQPHYFLGAVAGNQPKSMGREPTDAVYADWLPLTLSFHIEAERPKCGF
jgi:hypothetical protein